MGKGDRKSRKGKIWRGSYGNTRPKKSSTVKNKKPTLNLVPQVETGIKTETALKAKPVRKKSVSKKSKS